MITSFKSKGLKELFVLGKTSLLPQERIPKIKKILTTIHAATSIEDLRIPAFRLHRLKAPPYEGFWSIDISGNYRLVFQFANGDASNLTYIDTH